MDLSFIIVCCIACLVTGFTIGVVAKSIIVHLKSDPVGALKVDDSNPDGPYLFLELETRPENIMKEELITLRVETRK